MTAPDITPDAATDVSASARLGPGSWIVLIVLVSLLLAAFIIVYLGWTLANGTDVPVSGYFAMALGVIFSLAVGFGLMALIFYSSRKGYDEPPVLVISRNDIDSSGSPAESASAKD